jgi:hypothetical protein
MKKLYPAIILFVLAPFCGFAQSTCLTATTITIGTHVVDGIYGEDVPGPVCTFGLEASMGEWYRYVATHDTAIVITTDLPANVGGDTRFHVYTGTCGSLVCVGGDDHSGSGFLSVDTVVVQAGTTYHIAFDDYWSDWGFTFELKMTSPAVQPPGMVSFTTMSLPVFSACVVDMNGDHLDDAVGVTNQQVNIAIQQPGGGFQLVSIPTPLAMFMPTWSIAAGDIDGNGYNDLMYGSGQGATFMLRSDDGASFTQQGFTQYIFSQRTNMIDINNDGHLDAFVCHDVEANV